MFPLKELLCGPETAFAIGAIRKLLAFLVIAFCALVPQVILKLAPAISVPYPITLGLTAVEYVIFGIDVIWLVGAVAIDALGHMPVPKIGRPRRD